MILSAISNATAGAASATDGAAIADDFDAFLRILTTQLRNQNPLEPLDTNEFTAQLVQFSQVEQSIKTNENLESVVQLAAAAAATNAVGFIGKTVSVQTTQAVLSDGAAAWQYDSEKASSDSTFTIRDAAGNIVWQGSREVVTGQGSFNWDGRDNDGNQVADGTYSLTIEARDSDGIAIAVGISSNARIDGVDFSGSEPVLMAGDTRILMSDVSRIFD